MTVQKEISEFLKEISALLPDQIKNQIMEGAATEVISEIVANSQKTTKEALIVFLSAIKNLHESEQDTFLKLSKNNWLMSPLRNLYFFFTDIKKEAFPQPSEGKWFRNFIISTRFQKFIQKNREQLIELGKSGGVQFNVPERAFPVLETINRKIRKIGKIGNEKPIAVIELGASLGLLGQCLLEPKEIADNKGNYFLPEQKIPDNLLSIDYHLGIDLKIPEPGWILACEWTIEADQRLRNFLAYFSGNKNKNLKVIEGDAFDFVSYHEVKDLDKKYTQVILTSFLFFQIGKERSDQLKRQLLEFVGHDPENRYWINQTFIQKPNPKDSECIIELNGKKIITLADERCSDWTWVNELKSL